MTVGVQQLMLAVERIRDSFHAAVYSAGDLDAALDTVAAGCVLAHLPAGTGADGADALRDFLAEDVLPHLPADRSFRRISRTVDRWRVAEEATVEFTHDRDLPWLLPGVAPTHRRASVLAISMVSIRHSRITSHRTLWDHTTLLGQLQLDPADVARSRPARV